MRQYDPAKPLISIHVPKCAGITLQNSLEKWYGRRLLLHYPDEKRNLPPKKHKVTRIFSRRYLSDLCLHGHFNHKRGNGTNDYYPDVDQFITFLRDPFEVHLSNYYFALRLGSKGYWAGKPRNIENSEEGLQRYLTDNRRSFILAFFPSNICLDNYARLLEERYVYVGVAADMQTSVDNLAVRLGFKKIVVPKLNVSPRKSGNEDLLSEMKEEFIKNNRLEYLIYEYALQNYNS